MKVLFLRLHVGPFERLTGFSKLSLKGALGFPLGAGLLTTLLREIGFFVMLVSNFSKGPSCKLVDSLLC